MRSCITVFCVWAAACGGSRSAVRATPAVEVDTELIEACTPEWQEPPPAVCEPSDDGDGWKVPAGQALLQVITIVDDRGWENLGPNMLGAIVQLLDPVIQEGKDTPCALQVARWYRGRAHLALGHDRQAFLDFASVVRAGPGHPYYDEVEGALDLMAPRLPASVVQLCAANYLHGGAPVMPGRDEHWKPYTEDDPAP
jgi:hypothetical protein